MSGICFLCGRPVWAQQLVDYQADFAWEIEQDDLVSQIKEFAIRIDEQTVFTNLPNKPEHTDDYDLKVDADTHQYRLRFSLPLSVGPHSWEAAGINYQDEAIVYLPPNDFEVTAGLTRALTAKSSGTLTQSLRLILSTLVNLGSILFVFIFIIFIIMDLVFNRGQKLLFAHRGIKQTRTGFVFDTSNNLGVPFALITAKGVSEQGSPIQATAVTDVEGKYSSLPLPRGEYSIEVSCNGYIFPTRFARSLPLTPENFYKGEAFKVISEQQPIDPMIPMDLAGEVRPRRRQLRTRLLHLAWVNWQELRRFQPFLELILFLASIVGLLVNPRLLYVIAGVFYGIMVARRLINLFRLVRLEGRVIDNEGVPIAGAVVEIYQENEAGQRQSSALAVSDSEGHYRADIKPGDYRVRGRKNGYVALTQARTVNDDQVVKVDRETRSLDVTLVPTPELTEDFFFQTDSH